MSKRRMIIIDKKSINGKVRLLPEITRNHACTYTFQESSFFCFSFFKSKRIKYQINILSLRHMSSSSSSSSTKASNWEFFRPLFIDIKDDLKEEATMTLINGKINKWRREGKHTNDEDFVIRLLSSSILQEDKSEAAK